MAWCCCHLGGLPEVMWRLEIAAESNQTVRLGSSNQPSSNHAQYLTFIFDVSLKRVFGRTSSSNGDGFSRRLCWHWLDIQLHRRASSPWIMLSYLSGSVSRKAHFWRLGNFWGLIHQPAAWLMNWWILTALDLNLLWQGFEIFPSQDPKDNVILWWSTRIHSENYEHIEMSHFHCGKFQCVESYFGATPIP